MWWWSLALVMAAVGTADPGDESRAFDATIGAVHARVARATAARLRYAYNTSIIPIGDNCTSWNAEHGGIQGSTYANFDIILTISRAFLSSISP